MATICRFIRETDGSTILNLMSGADGGPGYTLLRGSSWGEVSAERDYLTQAPYPGGTQVDYRHPVIEANLRIKVKGSDLDDMLSKVRALGYECMRGGWIKLQPEGATSYVRIQIYATNVPQPWMGAEFPLSKKTVILDVRLDRHPHAIQEMVALDPVTLSNAVGDNLMIVDNPGQFPARAKVTIAPTAGEVVEARVGRKEIDTTTLADYPLSAASGVGTITQTQQIAKQFGATLNTAEQGALDGRYMAYVIGTCETVGEKSRFQVQLRWTSGPRQADVTNKRRTLDLDHATSNVRVAIPLGIVRVDSDTTKLEVWSRKKTSGSTEQITWDSIFLLPVRVSGTFNTPGHKKGGHRKVERTGGELVASGGAVIDEDDEVAKLNNVGEIASAEASEFDVDSGRHHVQVVVNVRNKLKERTTIGTLKVKDDTPATVAEVKLRSSEALTKVTRRVEAIFDADPAKDYNYEVEQTADPASSDARITVLRMTDFNVPFAADGDALVLDAPNQRAYLLMDDGTHIELNREGDYVSLAPGPNLLAFQFGDVAANAYKDALDDEPLAKFVPTRAAVVTVEFEPIVVPN